MIKNDPEMTELTSIILICCVKLYFIGRIISRFWRVFFDYQLSMVLIKLEGIHEKLIKLKVVDTMKIKMKCYFIIGISIYVIGNIIAPLVWMEIQTYLGIKEKVITSIETHVIS